ncbi:SulP family inorganic anion transporter [Pseudomonadota bacterium]
MTGPQQSNPDTTRGRFLPVNVALEISGAIVSTIIVVTFAVSFAGLIFAGDLSDYLPVGIGLGLVSTVVLAVSGAVGGSFAGIMASPQDKPAAIIGVAVAPIAGLVAASEVLPTVVGFIAVTSVVFGIALFIGGYFRLGGLVRYMPYPVIGGFLAGTGWLIFLGAFTFVGVPLDPQDLGALLSGESLIKWVPALLYGVALYVALRKSNHFIILPGFIAGGVVVSYVLFAFLDLGGTPAEAGLIIGGLPNMLWEADVMIRQAEHINWGFIVYNFPAIAAVVLISTIAMLLNETGIEVATRTRMDFNRDMRSTGFGNIVAGLGGGLAGYPLLGLSILNHRVGVSTRFVGLLTAGFTIAILLVGADALALFPRWVVAGILFFLAVDFLTEWLIDSRRTCSLVEYLLILFIMACIVTLGILEGIGLGVVIMAIVFVLNYSRIEVIKNELSGVNQKSNVQRSPALEQYIAERGQLTLILELQGYLFFGTTSRVLERVADRIETDPVNIPDFVVLDFRRVNGADSSAVLSFVKLRYLAQEHGLVLVFTNLSARIASQLRRGGCLTDDGTCVHLEDLDRGVEWCEDRILSQREERQVNSSLLESLREFFDADQFSALQNYLARREWAAGSIVFRQGETPDGMYFVESGSVSIVLNLDSDDPIRLRKFGEGTLFGEMSVYTQGLRSATVQVEEDAVIHQLSEEAVSSIERDQPDLANAFHRYIVRTLAYRLEHANKTLFALRH